MVNLSNSEAIINQDIRSAFMAEEFSSMPSNEWYLKGPGERDRTEVRDEFISNESLSSPDIAYTKVGTIGYGHLEKLYSNLLVKAEASGDDVLYEQIARKMAEMYRHKEVLRRVGGGAIDSSLSQKRAERMNEELFGELTEHDFTAALNPYLSLAKKQKDVLPEARELLELVGDGNDYPSADFDFAITAESLALLKQDLLVVFPKLKSALAPHEDRKVGMDEAAEWCNKVIAATGLDKHGWRAVKVPAKKVASTNVQKKLIVFGEERPDFASTTAMNETNIHEVIGHAYRAMQASAQQNPELRSKMPGTDDFEESFATALQQLVTQKPRIAGQRYVLAYGLGKGMDNGGNSRDFRQTYEILYRTLLIDDMDTGKPLDRLAAKQKAFQECSRTRRGGALDARDLSYFLGCKKSYRWMNEIAQLAADDRQAKLRWVLSGLFDPTNPEQADKYQPVNVLENV